jgi:hypothetical protein
MVAYLDAIAPEVWLATENGFIDDLTTNQVMWNAKARNAIFEAISEEVFARVSSINLACDIWKELIELHEGSSKVREQKYHLLRAKYDEFKMLPNESCNEMYSHLNVIVKGINALNISKIDKAAINQKILMLLPKPKYNIINAMLQKENLDTMEVVELVGEIRAHEMGILGMTEEPTTSKSIAFKAKVKKTPKSKMIKHEPSSSEQEDSHESSSDDEGDDRELALMMRKLTHLSDKIGKKGYSFDPKKRVFRPRGDDKNKTCYNCGEKGHISNNFPKPNKRKLSHKIKHHQDSSDDDDDNKKGKHQSYVKKKIYYKKSKHFPKKKGENKKSFVVGTQEWVTDVSSSEDSSDEDDIVGVALTDFEPPLPPPPMCLMAKGNFKVSDGESEDSDDELDPNKFANLIYEYTSVIKREKNKVKQLEGAHATLEASHNNLLTKYNELLKRHHESIVCAKQVDERYDKLKVEHKELTQKYQLLEVAYEALDQSFEHSTIENVVKVNVSTSCDDLLNEDNATNVLHEIVTSREKELMDQVASLKTSVDKLTRGEIMHKETLFYHACDYSKRGIGSFPETQRHHSNAGDQA